MGVSVLFTGLLLGIACILPAQVPEKYRFKKGEVVLKALPESKRYVYGNFKEGKILFVNGKLSTAKLNYNLLYGEMEYIDDSGDTLALADDLLVQNILVGPDLFYSDYQNALVKIVADFPALKLGAREKLVMIRDDDKVFVNPEYDHFRKLSKDEFSKHNTPPSVKLTYRQYYTNPLEEELLLIKVVNYFFIDQNNHFHPTKKKNIWKIYPATKGAIREFIKENNISFDQEEDLVKLVEFCNQLSVQ